MLCAQNKMYTQFIHKTEQQCKEEPLDGGSGPTMLAHSHPASPDAQQLQSAAASGSRVSAADAATARQLRQWRDKPPLTYVRSKEVLSTAYLDACTCDVTPCSTHFLEAVVEKVLQSALLTSGTAWIGDKSAAATSHAGAARGDKGPLGLQR